MALDAMIAKESASLPIELEWQIGDRYFSGTNEAKKVACQFTLCQPLNVKMMP